MANLNKVLLIGRLTRDPELRYTSSGRAVSDLGIAVNREYTVNNERRKETAFVDVTAWGRTAEVICEYLKKGREIFIEGRLTLDTWEQEGQKRSKLKVVADSFQFVGGGGGESREGGGDYGQSYGGGRGGGSRISQPSEYSSAPAREPEPEELGVPEEDIPF